jgi:MoaA/NifB/PqqE/SkfB family radical SAM enzyme
MLQTDGVISVIRTVSQRFIHGGYKVPLKLDMVVVEVTTYCGLKCVGCVRSIMLEAGEWDNRHIDVENFRRLVDNLPPAALFIPQGIGEPTMHPNILDLIKIAKNAKKFDRIEINTNALVRSTEFYSQLFDAGLDALTVSVDSLDNGIINIVRCGTELPKLEQRLREFAKSFPDKIGVRVTVSKWNLHSLPELLEKLNELGRFHVWLQPFFNMGNGEGVLDSDQALDLMAELSQLQSRFSDITITQEPMTPSESICTSPWRSPAIRVDGAVKPCCMIFYQEPIEFGNAFEEPFQKIWLSPKIEEFRRSFLKKSPKCCSRCPYFTPRR